MSAPTVSVVMAAYRGSALVGETIASLRAQTFADWELVVVDDCSKDDTPNVLRSFGDARIRLFEAAVNGGPVVARNLAMAQARGRYIAALDQDDICAPTRFEKQVAFLESHPETVLVSSAAALLIDGRLLPGTWPRPLSPVLIDWLLWISNPFAWSSVMFRADAARRLEPFERPERRYAEDFDLYHRLRPFGRMAQIDEELLHYRCHAEGVSQKYHATMQASAERLLADYHAERLGGEADETAALLVRHVMQRDPVPDRPTFQRLFDGIWRLRAAFACETDWDAAALAEVDEEIARRWRSIARAGVRSGALPLHEALAAKPAGIATGPGHMADLAASQLVGGLRALRQRLG